MAPSMFGNVHSTGVCNTNHADYASMAPLLSEEGFPVQDVIFWSALLGVFQKCGDVDVGGWAFEHAHESDGPADVLMDKLYAACGVQEAMKVENKAWS